MKAKYLFLPSCAYEIKTAEETYIVDREGTVRDSQGKEIELDTILAGDKDTTTVEPETLEEFKALLVEAGDKTYPGLTIDFEEGIITLKFSDLSKEQTKACSEMFVLINQNAKTLKHASSKQSETDNEKYAFRTWLIRLGMIGGEYKDARRTLLAKLEGNGAFRRAGNENV